MSDVTDTMSRTSTTSETPSEYTPAPVPVRRDVSDQPIPLWPEGVLALIAGATLLAIGFRHRTWLQRKAREGQRMLEEFQRQGGLDDLQQVARQATDFIRGGG